MEVSRQSDSITHAVLGKKESVEMGVSDSAALMHIFSTALYTHPELATVREVICNGWDGHIVVGKTDVPLDIRISEDHVLTIRDFGPGIPHERIGQIYGMFGNSTKRDDSTVTGGFGLGSKAPFAYTDNFEVTSCHNGVKSIYRMSKSSAERAGKPTIDTMVQIPTEETGLTVKIHLQGIHVGKFLNLITELLVLGEIKATVNGNLIQTLPLSESNTGYIICSTNGTLLSRINVRYGNVVYPVPRHEFFGEAWDNIYKTVGNLWNTAKIIFMLPPDSVTIAPSREALIFMEATLATLKDTFMQFTPSIARATKNRTVLNQQLTAQAVNKSIMSHEGIKEAQEWVEDITLPIIRGSVSAHATGTFAFTLRKASIAHSLSARGTYTRGNTDRILIKRTRHAIHKGTVEKLHGERIIKQMIKYAALRRNLLSHGSSYGNLDNILQRAVFENHTRPLLNMIEANPDLMDKSNLFAMSRSHRHATANPTSPTRISVGGLENMVGFLHKKILLVRSMTGIKQFFNDWRHRQTDYPYGWFVYMMPKTDKTYDDIQAKFEELGYSVVRHIPTRAKPAPKEVDPNAPVIEKEKKVSPKRKGYLRLDMSQDGNMYKLSRAREVSTTPEDHVQKPVTYVILNSGEKADRFAGLTRDLSRAVCKLWGKEIAVVTSVQAEKLQSEGVPTLEKFVVQYVDEKLSKAKDFPRYLAFSNHVRVGRHTRAHDTDDLIRCMVSHKTLMDSLNLRFHVSAETEALITFFEDDSWNGFAEKLKKCQEVAKKVKRSPQIDETKQTINGSPWVKFIEVSALAQALQYGEPDSPQMAVPYEIVRNLMQKDDSQ